MKIAILLNYVNYRQTVACCDNLLISGMDEVVIVDNASNNGSYQFLKDKYGVSESVHVIKSKKNFGYAQGNNIGLKYAESRFQLHEQNSIFIVNPDVVVSEKTINYLDNFVMRTPNAGAVTALINGTVNSAWHHMTPLSSFIYNSWILKWILLKMGFREGSFYRESSNEDAFIPVDVVTGAFFCIKQSVFKKIGYFDSGTFLYYEEEALYCRLLDDDFQNYLLNCVNFEHVGRGSTSLKKLSFKKINDYSRLYVVSKYYNAGSFYKRMYHVVNAVDNFILILLRRVSS
ncbi:glycosyltransferase [Levilactobacillus namurensis]|uniref:glycosyltransferase n=1 Tax=Levilactobacillus namurensis TaxID=380393 RepID=UPI00222EC375|nr:glycosyltransferase [Levilactobacillus namurensis]MCW3779558.1 glycosyltransferase [Levilactobacillus namurensis]MDT7018148.1 glycosyltransferase [Levilactobacillus namurensis]WNN64863.1 glycosyltransferase [Levilactobacillus namurensis]